MQQDFTKYREAKRQFTRLTYHSDKNISKEAKNTLKLYDELKINHGDFISAYYILQTYLSLIKNTPNNIVMIGEA